ncbi:MAG: hypothetical protein RLZZ381_2280, partial [Cyanobacteriota bacterium]
MIYETVSKALNLSQEINSPYDLINLARQGLFKSAIDSLAQ